MSVVLVHEHEHIAELEHRSLNLMLDPKIALDATLFGVADATVEERG